MPFIDQGQSQRDINVFGIDSSCFMLAMFHSHLSGFNGWLLLSIYDICGSTRKHWILFQLNVQVNLVIDISG